MLTCPVCQSDTEVIGFAKRSGKGPMIRRRRRCGRGHKFVSVEAAERCNMSPPLKNTDKSLDRSAHVLSKPVSMNAEREGVMMRLPAPIKRVLEQRARENFRSVGNEAAIIIASVLQRERGKESDRS